MLGGRAYMKQKKLHWCHNCNEERRMTKAEIEFHQVGQCEIENYKEFVNRKNDDVKKD